MTDAERERLIGFCQVVIDTYEGADPTADELAIARALKDILTAPVESDKTVKFYIDRCKLGSNADHFDYGPKVDQSGYEYAEVPKWQLMRWNEELLRARQPVVTPTMINTQRRIP